MENKIVENSLNHISKFYGDWQRNKIAEKNKEKENNIKIFKDIQPKELLLSLNAEEEIIYNKCKELGKDIIEEENNNIAARFIFIFKNTDKYLIFLKEKVNVLKEILYYISIYYEVFKEVKKYIKQNINLLKEYKSFELSLDKNKNIKLLEPEETGMDSLTIKKEKNGKYLIEYWDNFIILKYNKYNTIVIKKVSFIHVIIPLIIKL